jgi:ferrous iron transport protein A
MCFFYAWGKYMFKVGKKYRVAGFTDKCPASYSQKLLCVGFVPGQEFTVSRIAPLGDPLEVSIKGTQVSLRKSEINLIKVDAV